MIFYSRIIYIYEFILCLSTVRFFLAENQAYSWVSLEREYSIW